MLRIPFDLSFVGRNVVVYTTFGMLRGLVLNMDDDGVALEVNGGRRRLRNTEIRTIAPVRHAA